MSGRQISVFLMPVLKVITVSLADFAGFRGEGAKKRSLDARESETTASSGSDFYACTRPQSFEDGRVAPRLLAVT